jgi:hypothetical protein
MTNEEQKIVHIDLTEGGKGDMESKAYKFSLALTSDLSELTIAFINLNKADMNGHEIFNGIKNAMLGYHLSTMHMLSEGVENKKRFIDDCEHSFYESMKSIRKMLNV